MRTIASHCWLCRMVLALPRQGICSYCLRKLPPLPPSCPRCGLPSSHPTLLCGRCLQHPPPWQALIATGNYTYPLSQLLHNFKYLRRSELSLTLARLMLLSWLDARRQQRIISPQQLFVVPLARGRQWHRGFNQSERLAIRLAHWINCPFDGDAIIRIRATPAQRTLSAVQRRSNLLGAFRCHRDLHGQDVTIVDDVVTTGSTVTEMSKMLLEKGARSVQIWCLCRTLSGPMD